MRGGTGSGSFYRENVHTDRARPGLARLTDATRKHKHVLELNILDTGLQTGIVHNTIYDKFNNIFSFLAFSHYSRLLLPLNNAVF